MESKNQRRVLVKGLVVLNCIVVFVVMGYSVLFAQSASLFPGSEATISYDIAPEAEITMARYFLGPYQEKDVLQFEIEIKNVSSEEHRYKVTIFLDEGPAIGWYLPEKPKKGTIGIAPGETVKSLLPIYYSQESKGFLVKVEVFK